MARPAIRCMWQRTAMRKLSARSKLSYSSFEKTPACTRSAAAFTPFTYLAIQNSVWRSRRPPLPSFTLGSTM
jgi:hypothetical protein